MSCDAFGRINLLELTVVLALTRKYRKRRYDHGFEYDAGVLL